MHYEIRLPPSLLGDPAQPKRVKPSSQTHSNTMQKWKSRYKICLVVKAKMKLFYPIVLFNSRFFYLVVWQFFSRFGGFSPGLTNLTTPSQQNKHELHCHHKYNYMLLQLWKWDLQKQTMQ